MSRSDLCSMAHIIDPKNIISVTLSDEIQTPGQIRLFLIHFQIDQFIRLRSLNLVKVNFKDFNQFQKHIIKCQLTTLSITLCDYYQKDPTALISSLISHNNLRKFEYIGNYNILHKIRWPTQCRLIHVIIGHYNFNVLCSTIVHLPYLQTLVVKDIFSVTPVVTVDRYDGFPQLSHLTSLSLNMSCNILMADIESVLSFLPTLTHLQLMSEDRLLDTRLFNGSCWENFIQAKLPLLSKFEFCFIRIAITDPDCITVESVIASFRTPLWLEIKRWILKCHYEYDKYYPKYHLYSIPIIRDNFDYPGQRSMIRHSASNTTDNDAALIVNAHRLTVDLSQIMGQAIPDKANATMPYLFPNVTELKIVINETWSASLVKHLYKIITLWNLETLWLDFQCERMSTVNLSIEMNTLLKLASNIRSIKISCNKSERMKMVTFNAICLKLPHHIKRLDTDIIHVADAKTLLKHAQHLKSVTFRTIDPWHFVHEIDLWLWQMKINTVYQVDAIRLRHYDDFEPNNVIHLWLGKTDNQQSNISQSHKRIKRY
ncbi:unnamed protein product [Rotaria magnacalcarata]|uniref:Uncharacterized protein n=1 Tax=Rotaria magnacalcarata TaxID=392030 RepID=A0A816ZGC6_9BILA|nr:unnamed protein product [Rotaria magnacalcarata]